MDVCVCVCVCDMDIYMVGKTCVCVWHGHLNGRFDVCVCVCAMAKIEMCALDVCGMRVCVCVCKKHDGDVVMLSVCVRNSWWRNGRHIVGMCVCKQMARDIFAFFGMLGFVWNSAIRLRRSVLLVHETLQSTGVCVCVCLYVCVPRASLPGQHSSPSSQEFVLTFIYTLTQLQSLYVCVCYLCVFIALIVCVWMYMVCVCYLCVFIAFIRFSQSTWVCFWMDMVYVCGVYSLCSACYLCVCRYYLWGMCGVCVICAVCVLCVSHRWFDLSHTQRCICIPNFVRQFIQSSVCCGV